MSLEARLGKAVCDEWVSRWLHTHPDARSLPYSIDSYLQSVERERQARTFDHFTVTSITELQTLAGGLRELEDELESWSERRRVERRLADYIAGIPDPHDLHGLADLADRLRACRCRGPVGISPQGRRVIAWDHKCRVVRLCPDEARAESMRVAEKYIPNIQRQLQAHPKRRAWYGVLTLPDARPGRLARMKRAIWAKFKRWLKTMPQVVGALAVLEDPLSHDGDWHVHLNVILLTHGQWSFKQAQEAWGYWVKFNKRPLDPDRLVPTLLELVKYSAMAVSEKSDEKATRRPEGRCGTGKADRPAPGMTEWDHALWLEWWAAQQRHRRTRSYGLLYGKHLVKPEREPMDTHGLRWVGMCEFTGGRYQLDMPEPRASYIPADNFQNDPAWLKDMIGAGGIRAPPDNLEVFP